MKKINIGSFKKLSIIGKVFVCVFQLLPLGIGICFWAMAFGSSNLTQIFGNILAGFIMMLFGFFAARLFLRLAADKAAENNSTEKPGIQEE